MSMDKLFAGGAVVGTMLRVVRNPAVVRIAANAGLDFVMLDMEHGSYSFDAAADMFAAARAAGLGALVRVPELARGAVSRALDCGAHGVMVPMIETPDQARALAGWAKFAPVGSRGLGSAGGHTDFARAGDEFPAEANRRTLAIAQIETVKGVENAEEIAAEEGIDALLIGPNDLAMSLAHACPRPAFSHEQAIERTARAASAAGRIFGIHAGLPLIEKALAFGARLLIHSLDVTLLEDGMRGVARAVRERAERAGSARA